MLKKISSLLKNYEMERRAVVNREDGKLEQNVGREDGKEIGWEIRDKSSDYDCIRWEKLFLNINPLPHPPPALAPAGLGRCPPGLSCRSTRGIGATGTQQEGREQCGARSAWGGGEVESRGNWTLYISKIFIQLRLTCVNNIQQSKLIFFSPSSPKSLFPHPRLLVLLLLLLLLQEHFLEHRTSHGEDQPMDMRWWQQGVEVNTLKKRIETRID